MIQNITMSLFLQSLQFFLEIDNAIIHVGSSIIYKFFYCRKISAYEYNATNYNMTQGPHLPQNIKNNYFAWRKECL